MISSKLLLGCEQFIALPFEFAIKVLSLADYGRIIDSPMPTFAYTCSKLKVFCTEVSRILPFLSAYMSLRAEVTAEWQESLRVFNREQPGVSGVVQFGLAWSTAIAYMKPRDISDTASQSKSRDHEKIRSVFELIGQCNKLPMLLEVFLGDVKAHVHLIEKEVVQEMTIFEENGDCEVIRRLIKRLVRWYNAWAPLPLLGETVKAGYTATFRSELYAILPPSFSRGFKALVAATLPDPDGPIIAGTSPISEENTHIWAFFEPLGLVDRYDSVISSVAYECIEEYVLRVYAATWDEPVLPKLRDWMAGKIVPWMLMPYARGAKSPEEARAMLQGVGSRFDFHMNKTLCEMRTREIFDIIVDYPESSAALQDIKDCLGRTDERMKLVKSLRAANKRRLLHPGADTKDILAQYVSTIRCLRIIDPPGVLLFKVADPIRRYLRDRPDTIKSIVASLVGDAESGDSLVDDDEPIRPLQTVEIDDYTDPHWVPEPIDAGPDFRSHSQSDVISTLVSIYDSKDLFIKEVQILLAQRLLAINDSNYEKEHKNIEILKIRFGETALQVCEVMLKDMTDSRRIDQHIQSHASSVLHSSIISRHFWPALDGAEITMPGQFAELQKQHSTAFSNFKPDKALRWLPQLGSVRIQLQLQDRSLDVDVPPVEAATIELFSEKDIWSIDELANRLNVVNKGLIRKALLTWLDLGVLKEADDLENYFVLLEIAEEAQPPSILRGDSDMDATSNRANTQRQEEADQMRTYWKFIEAMLTNLGGKSLDQVQGMMKLAPGYSRSIEDLELFLEAARREGLLTLRDGIWRLNK